MSSNFSSYRIIAKAPFLCQGFSEINHTEIIKLIQVEVFWVVTPFSVVVGY
jgi:hypothetical protein